MSNLQRSDPAYYTDFVSLIRVSDFKSRIKFPIALTDITELEKINRTGGNPIPFRGNVFREDPISRKIHLIRSSPLDDGNESRRDAKSLVRWCLHIQVLTYTGVYICRCLQPFHSTILLLLLLY